jgi:uncharacterized GH25 family protein
MQNGPGILLVTVRDDQGQPLPGATVTLVTSGGPVMCSTDENGQATFENQPAGTYGIEISLEGFAPVKGQVDIEPDRINKAAFALSPAVHEELAV